MYRLRQRRQTDAIGSALSGQGKELMSFVTGLQCRECGQKYPQEPLHVCELCFGPLEIQYDYPAIKKH